jgi:hypothetical protein
MKRLLTTVFLLFGMFFYNNALSKEKIENDTLCNEELVFKMLNNTESLNFENSNMFLSSLNKECDKNAELSQAMNELLFVCLEKRTDLAIACFHKKNEIQKEYIMNQYIEKPISDKINLRIVYRKVLNSRSDRKTKKQILNALKKAIQGE